MCDYDDILKIIHLYYPQNCKYSSRLYKKSNEFINYKNKLKDLKRRKQLSKMIEASIKIVFSENHITKYTNNTYPSIHLRK